MKKLIITITIAILTLTFTLSTPKVQAADIGTSICQYVAADDKKRLRSFLKSTRLKIRRIFGDIKCNGENLLEFAVSSGSVETGTLIISKLPKNVVSDNLPAVQAGPQLLIDAANDRVSG